MKNDALKQCSRPADARTGVKDALESYMTENGFDVGEYTSPTFQMRMFGRSFALPNSPDRRRAVPLHDLHHVATGYKADLAGEAEIAVWELRAGCRTAVVYGLNVAATMIGLVIAPRRVLAAYRAAEGAQALYRKECSYDALLGMSVGELRAFLGIPEDGAVGRTSDTWPAAALGAA